MMNAAYSAILICKDKSKSERIIDHVRKTGVSVPDGKQ